MRGSLITALLLGWVTAAAVAQELRVGAAQVKITPPVGIGMAGYYFERGAQGTHDELFARAIVIQSGDTRVALVGLDLIGTTRPMVETARQIIEKETGIPGANVMISATHAHTGPVLTDRGQREDAQGGAADLTRQYAAELPKRIAQSVKEGNEKLAPARASVAIGREERLSFNRRFHMKDGTVGWNPGKLNPNIVRPAGPIDPDVGVILFEKIVEKGPAPAIATYVNFAMHPDTVGGEHFSADYPGVLANLLAGYKGEQMVTLFANGCCGNINHVDTSWAGAQKGHAEAHRIGTILSAEVLQSYKKLQPATGALRVGSQMVELPLPKVTAEQTQEARVTIAKYGMKDNRGFIEKVQAYKVLDVASRGGRPHQVEVQVVILGEDLAIVSMPGEIFVELGLDLKKRSPFKHTLIAELANGAIGYIPDRKAYAEGAYEPISARCAEGSGEMLVEAAVKMLKELK